VGIEGEELQAKSTENTINKVIAENFPNRRLLGHLTVRNRKEPRQGILYLKH
jgi:hypothetical protein